jgi:hypothetical protein
MNESEAPVQVPSRTRSCLRPGCGCTDSRIVSPRRAAFHAAVARVNGQTANRRIDPEPSWRLTATTL